MDADVNQLRTDWTSPTHIRFGAGRITELAACCAELNIERPLIVTDPGLAGSTILRQVVASCHYAGLEPVVFSDTRKNPTLQHAENALAAFRSGGHDGIIAFGGGTPMETAKVLVLLAGESRPVWDFEVCTKPGGNSGATRPSSNLPPLIAVPTTAGSGAESRPFAVIGDSEQRRKRVLRHQGMLPCAVILDPVLTIDLPPILTAATGMNAMANNLEAFCAPGFDPMAEGVAAEGVRLARVHLPHAFRNAADLVARASMMASAAMGGMAFRRGLGAIQAMADPVAAITDAHQGLVSAVLTPYVLSFNRPAVEERICRLAAYVGLDKGDFDSFLGCLLTMREEVGIPHTLRGLGMSDTIIDRLAAEAAADPFAAGNPVPVDADIIAGIYRNAMEGWLA